MYLANSWFCAIVYMASFMTICSSGATIHTETVTLCSAPGRLVRSWSSTQQTAKLMAFSSGRPSSHHIQSFGLQHSQNELAAPKSSALSQSAPFSSNTRHTFSRA